MLKINISQTKHKQFINSGRVEYGHKSKIREINGYEHQGIRNESPIEAIKNDKHPILRRP
jgi:hypothetical protein